MDKRKDAILGFLKASGQASMADVASHLEVSKQGALRHLEALLAEGLVEKGNETHVGPGRPEHVFRLTAAAAEHFPHAHRELAGELVKFMGAAQLERFFVERAARTEATMAAELVGLTLEQKVKRIGELASASGHMTEVVDNGDGSYAIRHCNCPIGDVAAETGHPCHREQSMYERLLGTPVERTTWLANNDAACTYVIDTKKGMEREIHG
ncbi:MAG TPA: MarR family transcriptional regulator [Candidatus Dormibacteraeota bacterium]